MASKSEIKAAELRVTVLRAEMAEAQRLGGAAVRCVAESLAAAESRLAVLIAECRGIGLGAAYFQARSGRRILAA